MRNHTTIYKKIHYEVKQYDMTLYNTTVQLLMLQDDRIQKHMIA